MTLASFHDLGLPTESVAVRNNSLHPVRVSTITRWLPWVARVAWVFVAVVGGQAIEAAVDGRSAAVRWVAGVGGWAAWGVVLGALLIASVRSLTIVRVGVPVSAAVALAVVVAGVSPADFLAFVVPAAITLFAVFTAEFGRSFVQASAYGDEERFPLRPPAAVGVAAVVSWLVWAAAIVAGPLLLAAHSWIAGAVVTVLAVAGTVLLAPRWHRLSRRWLVLVPAGIVVHDPVVLADTVSLRTNQVRRLRLAEESTEAADLTGPASGYAVEIETTETITAVFAFTPKEPNGRAIHLTAFLVGPSRPGQALAAAARRGLPVG